jgi:hypothetical protein
VADLNERGEEGAEGVGVGSHLAAGGRSGKGGVAATARTVTDDGDCWGKEKARKATSGGVN